MECLCVLVKCGGSRQKWKMKQANFLQSFFVCVLTWTEIPIRPITDSKTSEFKPDVNVWEHHCYVAEKALEA